MKEEVKRALDGKGGKSETHTHGVHYERSANGGYHAHVHKHHGPGPHSEGHSHTEEHILPDAEAAKEHFDEHMGDHPEFGEEMGEQQPDNEGAEMANAGGGGGAMQA